MRYTYMLIKAVLNKNLALKEVNRLESLEYFYTSEGMKPSNLYIM